MKGRTVLRVETDVSGEWDSSTDWPALAERAVGSAVAHSARNALIRGPAEIEVSVKFSDDAEVRSLNAHWRGKDKATNVLSFPMIEPGQLDGVAGPGEILLGDIVIAHGVCAVEARDKGISLSHHAAHLVVHGTLHLLGYDHETSDEDAEAMETVEWHALAAMNIADPYPVTEVQS
jgi:probable rRNA maturation factor